MIGAPAPIWISADEVRRALSRSDAVEALRSALLGGLLPGADPHRIALPAPVSELLVMPSEYRGWLGTKLLSVTPANSEAGLPRIQGVYVIFDDTTATPVAVLDAVALTDIRTPAVSMLAIGRRITRLSGEIRAVVFGAGPQAIGHLEALMVDLEASGSVLAATVITRTPSTLPRQWHHSRRLSADDLAGVGKAVKNADVIICATSASTPLFRARDVRDDATVVAVGSHHRDRRELSSDLMARATVVVEDVEAALREAGDVTLAMADGVLDAGSLVTLADIVTRNETIATDRPMIFKSVGMAWEDLVLAREAVLRVTG